MRRIYCVFFAVCSVLAGCSQPQEKNYFTVKPTKSFDEFVGANVYEWNFQENFERKRVPEILYHDKTKWIDTLAWVRHYIDWDKIEAEPGQYTFNPTAFGGWNYDTIYGFCRLKGVQVLACIKGIPAWLQNTYPTDKRDLENIPAAWQSNLENPASYVAQARMAYQFAARYGRTKIPLNQLSVHQKPRWVNDTPNTIKTGLGIVFAMECDNERDKWWKGKQAEQTAEQYAANLSAYYDGHLGTLGKNIGVKNADPSMLVVMAGLAKPDTNFVAKMVQWCAKNRGYKKDGSVNLCFDVVNYHYYANNAKSQEFTPTSKGVAPEFTNAATTANAFYTITKRNNVPVWLTETGYDLHPESAQGVPGKTEALREQLRTEWLLRTCLLYYKTGIEKLALYQLWDDGANTATPFATTGLMTKQLPTKTLQAILGAGKILKGFTFEKHAITKNRVVDTFKNAENKLLRVVYVASTNLEKTKESIEVGKGTKVYTFNVSTGNYQLTTTKATERIAISGMPIIIE